MKINRTFTMDLSTIELLKGKMNKSLIVNLAVRRYLHDQDSYSPSDMKSKQLLAILSQRTDMSPILINAIKFELLHSFK